MKTHPIAALVLITTIATILVSCDSRRGESREVQLEQTATDLEAKAEKVLEEVKESAAVKEQKAKILRETEGDEDAAVALEKDADVTLQVGKMRAAKLEENAKKVREEAEKEADAAKDKAE